MSPQGERHKRKLRYRANNQTNSRAGPSPGGQPFAQNQAGFGGPGMAQPYQQMPGSDGGYGRGGQPQQQWGQPNQANFNQNGFGGYQG